jgi:hypothetical protein
MAFVKLYDRKNALVAADFLNDRVIPWYDEHEVKLLRILTDRGTEYCGNRERHEFQLYLAIEDIDHSKTKAKSPQTNGVCERFHKTIQDEFYAVAFRKKIYHNLDEIQEDADKWIEEYIRSGHTQGNIASARHRTKRFWIARDLQTIKCWTGYNRQIALSERSRLSDEVLASTIDCTHFRSAEIFIQFPV